MATISLAPVPDFSPAGLFDYLRPIKPLPKKLLALIEVRDPSRQERKVIDREIRRCKAEIRAAREAVYGPS
jgi:hypothetical protein